LLSGGGANGKVDWPGFGSGFLSVSLQWISYSDILGTWRRQQSCIDLDNESRISHVRPNPVRSFKGTLLGYHVLSYDVGDEDHHAHAR
jgi:hypothetical protein